MINDGLENDQQRAEAWKTFFNISPVGVAIVDRDGMFVSVNETWVKMLGVPATEFYGKRFQDITVISDLELDLAQAELVLDGKINAYEMDKTYVFHSSGGEKSDVRLSVGRVPFDMKEDFLFFLSMIVLRRKPQTSALTQSKSSMSLPSPDNNEKLASIAAFVLKYWFMIAVGSAVGVGLVAGFINELFQMGWF